MNWFQQNRFLGTFLVVLGVGAIACAVFLCLAKSSFGDAEMQFDRQATELAALQRHNPFPTEANLRKMKTQAEEYGSQLTVLKEDLKTRVLPVVPLAPNEFQARLRQAMASVTEKARAHKVRLPENFYLGFEEFSAALPATEAAPLLGQQLAQVELILDILIDARVDAVTSLKRVPLATATSPATTPSPGPGRKPNTSATAVPLLERTAIDAAFGGTPGAVRRALNQLSTINQQFYIIRTLHILNEKEKGPPRDGAGAAAAFPAPGGLNFIVGNERVTASTRIELVRFTF